MKKYFVSLGCNEPVNWEIEVEAKNQREAIKEARRLFDDSPESGEFIDPGMGTILMGNKAVHVEDLTGETGN